MGIPVLDWYEMVAPGAILAAPLDLPGYPLALLLGNLLRVVPLVLGGHHGSMIDFRV
jgi:hypothetical protein